MQFDPRIHKIVAVVTDGPDKGQHMHLSLPDLVGAVAALPESNLDWDAVNQEVQKSTQVAVAAFDELARQYEDLRAKYERLERIVEAILDTPIITDISDAA